jgi:RHS repeat-associated protein
MPNPSVTINVNATGRYVRVQLNGTDYLSLAEVQVFGAGAGGEEVTYQYDALNRLSRAETTDAAWGNAYTYDGWGNLTGKSVTKGTAPTLSAAYDPALNMTVGSNPPSYLPWNYADSYDVEDRPLNVRATMWSSSYIGKATYDHTGKKVFWIGDVMKDEQQIKGCEVWFYGITGQKLARYTCEYAPTEQGGNDRVFAMWLRDRTQHIGGQVTSWNGGASTTDRLGSLRARDGERYTYYPYGEVRTESVAGGGVYAGLESPLREYDAGRGRFDRPDPLGLGAVKLGDPGSWNRFAYVQGDPVNYWDPEGLAREAVYDIGLRFIATGIAGSGSGGCRFRRWLSGMIGPRYSTRRWTRPPDDSGYEMIRGGGPSIMGAHIGLKVLRICKCREVVRLPGLALFADKMAFEVVSRPGAR